MKRSEQYVDKATRLADAAEELTNSAWAGARDMEHATVLAELSKTYAILALWSSTEKNGNR